MKSFILTIKSIVLFSSSIFILVSLTSFYNYPSNDLVNTYTEDKTEWVDVFCKDGIKVYQKEIAFHDVTNDFHAEYVIFKFENTNDERLLLTWNFELHYDGVCRTCKKTNQSEYYTNLALQANQTYICRQQKPEDKERIVFKKLLQFDSEVLTACYFQNFKTHKL